VGRSTLYRKLAKHDIAVGGRVQPELAPTEPASERCRISRDG